MDFCGTIHPNFSSVSEFLYLPVFGECKKTKSYSAWGEIINTFRYPCSLAKSIGKNFVRFTTPMERDCWKPNELENFIIRLSDVDRLYYLDNNRGFDENKRYAKDKKHIYDFIGRVNYNGHPLYVEFMITLQFTNFLDVSLYGTIFISGNCKVFTELVLRKNLRNQLMDDIIMFMIKDLNYNEYKYFCTEHDHSYHLTKIVYDQIVKE